MAIKNDMYKEINDIVNAAEQKHKELIAKEAARIEYEKLKEETELLLIEPYRQLVQIYCIMPPPPITLSAEDW